MDISAFTTKLTAGPGKPAGLAPGAGANGLLGGFAAGLNFMDIIFAQIAAQTDTGTTPDGKGKPDTAAHTLLTKLIQQAQVATDTGAALTLDDATTTLTAEQILEALANDDPDLLQKLEDHLANALPPEDADDDTNAPGQQIGLGHLKKKLTAALQTLLQGIPQGQTALNIDDLTQAKTLLVKFTEEDSSDGASPALIATGLSPEELTQLLKDLADGKEDSNLVAIALINIAPQDNKQKDIVFLPRGSVAVQARHPAGDIATPEGATTDALASKLNDLTTGGSDTGIGSDEESDFAGVLRLLEKAQPKNDNAQIQAHGRNVADKVPDFVRSQSPGLSTIQNAGAQDPSISAALSIDDMAADGSNYALMPGHNLQITGAAPLTNLVANAPQAAYPHPATQMIAATISKAAGAGESKNITLNLDPPELGKVQVRLEFKDHALKAHMVIEKPETYMMLQRDAQLLQRALHDAGIDANGGGLSFELSQDGNFFNQGNDGGTGGNSGGGSAGGNTDGDATDIVIETHMDWYIDPHTGLTRYDALV